MTDIADQPDTIADEAEVDAPATSRRNLMTKGLIAVAVGAAAGTAMKDTASAANGSNFVIGNVGSGTNSASNTTRLQGGSSLEVINGQSDGSASIYGTTDDTGGDYGVRGRATGTQSVAGVYGDATSDGVAGVLGAHQSSSQSGPGVMGTSDRGTGVVGEGPSLGVLGRVSATDGGTGVRGTTTGTQGTGVNGLVTGSDSTGVLGRSTARGSIGVFGSHVSASANDPGTGVRAASDRGPGIRANGTTSDVEASGSGILLISAAASPAPATTATGTVGSIARGANGTLWFCYETNKWTKLAGGDTAGSYHAVNPYRAIDSRTLVNGPGALGANQNRTVSVKDAKSLTDTTDVTQANVIPVGATAITFNLTIVNTVGGGFLAVTSGDATEFGASTANWGSSGVVVANASVVPIDATRSVKVWNGSPGSTDFIIDVTGYYL